MSTSAREREPDHPVVPITVPQTPETEPGPGNAALGRILAELQAIDDRLLRHGDRGEPVAWLQQGLTAAGIDTGAIDAIFGQLTQAAVMRLQRDAQLDVDGVVGPQTFGTLQDLLGGGTPVGQAPVGQTPVGEAPVGQAPVGQAPVEQAQPSAGTPTGQTGGTLSEVEETWWEGLGAAAIVVLNAAGGRQVATGGGDTSRGAVAEYPAWFGELQDILVCRTEWLPQREELAQNVLYGYGMARIQREKGFVSLNVQVYLRYIGRSEHNQRSAAKNGCRNTGEMGGAEGNSLWCAAAGTASIDMGLAALGLAYGTGKTEWLTKHKGVPQVYGGSSWVEHQLEPGDQVSYLALETSATGGHTVTVVEDIGGGRFTHVSGNAGGESVREGSSGVRVVPPLTVNEVVTTAQRPPKGEVWLYSILGYAQMWRDLQAFHGQDPSVWQSPAAQAVLAAYHLKPSGKPPVPIDAPPQPKS